MTEESCVFLYVTTTDEAEAKRLGRLLVEENLCACANVLGGMTPIFRWQGRIEEGSEAVLIAKTRGALVERVTARLREAHSYDCPCVVALPVAGGNPEFLSWIVEETAEA